MLKGKERAYLRRLSHNLIPLLVGKDGMTDPVLRQLEESVNAKELIKVKLQTSCPDDASDLADEAASALGAEVVSTVGRSFVLYRHNPEVNLVVIPK